MRKMHKYLALLLCAVMVLGMIPTVTAVDGAPVPSGTAATAQWEEIQEIVSQYYGEWTDTSYPGAVNNRIPNTAIMGNGDVGISSAGSDAEKTFNISKGDFWEYNDNALVAGSISIGPGAVDDGNLARQYSKVTASSGNGALAVNGRSTAPNDGYTGWVSDTQETPQWLALEFDEAITFNTWTVRNSGFANDRNMNAITRAAELQISDDGQDWKTISSFADNGLSVAKTVMDEKVTTKHVRLLVTAPTQPNYSDTFTRISQFILSVTEVDEDEKDKNLALNYKTVKASTEHESLVAANAVNGKWAEGVGYEGWTSKEGNPQWMMLGFEEAITFNRWVVRNDGAARPAETANNTKDCELQIWEGTGTPTGSDATGWKTVSTVTGNSANVIDITMSENVTTQWVRLYVSKGTQETTDDSRNHPRARVGAFELYNVAEKLNVNLMPGFKSYKTSTQHESLSAQSALDGSFVAGGGYCGWTSEIDRDVPMQQYLMVDMGKAVTFNRWVVHNDAAARPGEEANSTQDCQLQVWTGAGVPTGDETEGWTAVDTVTGNSANTIDRRLDVAKTAQYLRLCITKGTQETTDDSRNNPRARVAGFEIYNMEGGDYNVNLALGYKNTNQSSVMDNNSRYNATAAVNGAWNANSDYQGWISLHNQPEYWMMLDMGENITFNRWVVRNDGAGRPGESPNNTKDCQLQVWTGSGVPIGGEAEGWTDVDTVTGNAYNVIDRSLSTDCTAQYIRLKITGTVQSGDARARIGAFELYNMKPKTEMKVNVAAGADIYVCNIHSDGEAAANMVDGKINGNKWCCTKDCGTHYAILDLKEKYTLTSYLLVNAGMFENNHSTVGFEIQYLETAENMDEAALKAATQWKTATSVSGNTADQTSGDFASAVDARYVRLWLTDPAPANEASRIHEMELYGYKAAEESVNVAAGKTIYTCDHFVDNGTPWPGEHMVDGKIDNLKWCCVNSETHYAILDLGEVTTLGSYKLVNSGQVGEYDHNTHAFKIEYLATADDLNEGQLKAATDWLVAEEVTGNTQTVVTGEFGTPVDARYVRLWLTDPTVGSNGAARIHEWELYNYVEPAPEPEPEPDPEPNPNPNPNPEPEPDEPIAFNEKEDILNAEVVTQQNLAGADLQIESWMSATNNLFVMEITSLEETEDADLSINLEGYVGGNRPNTSEVGDDYMVVTRSSLANGRVVNEVYETTPYISKVAMATKVIGAEGTYEVLDDAAAFVNVNLPAGETVYVVTAVCGGGRTYTADGQLWDGRTEPVTEAKALLDTVKTAEDVQTLNTAHRNWWKDYWMQSYISLDTSDKDLAALQKYYYAAQYELGSGIRDGNIAAGLYGIWHTTDTASWHTDYHLNYNFISTYYGLATSNRTSMLLPAVDALMDYIPQGLKNASTMQQLRAVYSPFIDELIAKGQVDPVNGIKDAILFPVSIGPYGMTLENNSYHHETINAPMSAFPLIEYYNYTQDKQFMEDTLYTYLKYVANFAEAWFVEENGGYTLFAGYNEGSWAKNAALELAAYKMCLKYAIQIGTELGEDADKLAKWKEIYDGLADQPMVENYSGTGKTVLSLAAQQWNGSAWVDMTTPVPGDGNCIPLEAIMPFEVYGYYSSDEDLKILQDTIEIFDARGGWTQINNFPKLAVNAVNARYDAKTVVAKLAAAIRSHMKQNMMIDDNVHGIEKAGATEAINNMLLLSDQGVIKLFGNWLADKDASFHRLRASGAFVFSAEYDGDSKEIVEGATMYSEAGATATVASLWDEGMIVLDENGNRVNTTKGTAPNHDDEITYTFETEAGKTYTFIKKTAINVTGVTLDKTEATVADGQTLQLTATVAPEDADDVSVSWSSSDEDVATVDQSGKVTAVAKGEATITVTTTDGGKTATCKVTVTVDTSAIDTAIAAANTAKTGVEESDKTADQVAKGTKFVSAAEMKALTDAIAAAEAAKSTVKTTAEVTAAVNALNTAVDTFKQAIKTGTYVAVTGVSLNKEAIVLTAGTTEELTATVAPEIATNNKISWSSSDEDIATVDQNGKVTAVAKGEATITVTTTDGGKTATCKVTVTVDTSAIDTAIAAANTAKTGVEESDKTADQVAKGTKFVSAAEMKALTDAIAAAEAAKSTVKTTAEVTAAVNALNTAVDTFKQAIKTGTYVPEIETKVEVAEGGIKEVPEALKDAGFDTPEEVKEVLVKALTTASGATEDENIAHYDVTFMYTENDGETWLKADEEHFPANGKLQVTLPYPKGTDKTYTFTVVHMFTSDAFGKTPGDVELPKVTNTDDGIRFEVTGLSPISVSWEAPGYDCTVSGHKLTKVTAKAATTEAEGNIEHYICSECGKYFSDAEGKNEITKESVVIPKLTPTDPTPTEPAPTQPTPTEPAPTQPTPTEPAPTQPAPTQPAPTEPAPTQPAPTQPQKPESNTPVTGDNFPMVLVGTLMLISLFGIAFILLWSKRSFTGKHVK